MTGKADFTEEEWKLVLEGPPSAGMIVIASDRGGSIRESFSMAKAYTEARKQHGESELLDEIVSAKPEMDHTRYKTPEELKEASLKNVTDAVPCSSRRPAPRSSTSTRSSSSGSAQRVAEARKEGFMGLSGDRVSDDEKTAIGEISGALG